MKKFVRFVLGIFAVAITYAGFEVAGVITASSICIGASCVNTWTDFQTSANITGGTINTALTYNNTIGAETPRSGDVFNITGLVGGTYRLGLGNGNTATGLRNIFINEGLYYSGITTQSAETTDFTIAANDNIRVFFDTEGSVSYDSVLSYIKFSFDYSNYFN